MDETGNESREKNEEANVTVTDAPRRRMQALRLDSRATLTADDPEGQTLTRGEPEQSRKREVFNTLGSRVANFGTRSDEDSMSYQNSHLKKRQTDHVVPTVDEELTLQGKYSTEYARGALVGALA